MVTEEQKIKLDANIRAMLAKGATQEDVKNYANDFKSKFVINKDIVPTGKTVGGIPTVTLEEPKNKNVNVLFTKDINKSQTVPFFGFNFILPKTTNKKEESSEESQTSYKGLLEFNTKKALTSFSAPLPLEQTRNEIEILKNANPDQISEFTKIKKQEVEDYYALNTDKYILQDAVDNQGKPLVDYNKINQEVSLEKSKLDNLAKQKSFENSPFMYKDINGWINAPKDVILKAAYQIGNNIQNVTDEESRSLFLAKAELPRDFGGFTDQHKENLAYIGIQSEANAITNSIKEDVNKANELSSKIDEYSEILKQNPNNPSVIKEVNRIITEEIRPLELTIKGKENFRNKLKEVADGFTEINKRIKRQKEVEENFVKYSGNIKNKEWSDLSLSGAQKEAEIATSAIGYATKGFLNKLLNTAQASTILQNELELKLGLKENTDEFKIKQTNLLSDLTNEEYQFALPQKIKSGEVIKYDEKGKIIGVNWNVAAPMIMQTTAETLTMGKIASPLGKYGTTGKITGLYAGAGFVFGGDLFKAEIQKGLSIPEATAVTSLRLAAEAVTEMINPLEFAPFNGIIKKGKLGSKLLSKVDFLNYVGDNWGKILPKYKARGLDGLKILFYTAKNAGYESLEEVASDLLNVGVDIYTVNNIVPDYKGDNEFTVDNEINTMLTTALTMIPMAVIGGYAETKAGKLPEYVRWTASQEHKSFLSNLESNYKSGNITKDFYEAGVKEVNTLEGIYTANKLKIDNTEEEQRPTYLNLLYEQKQVSEELLSIPDEKKEAELIKRLEDISKKIQVFDTEAIAYIKATPEQKLEKKEKRHIENLKEFTSDKELETATTQDLETAKGVLQEIVNNPFSENVGEEAKKQIEKILVQEEILKNSIKEAEEIKEQKIELTPIQEFENRISTASQEDLKKIREDIALKIDDDKESKQLRKKILNREDDLLKEEKNITFKDGKNSVTFKEGTYVTYEGNTYKVQRDKDGKPLLLNDKTDVPARPSDVLGIEIKKQTFTPVEKQEPQDKIIDKNLDSKDFISQEGLFEVFGEPTQKENPQDIEAKKADIERRRQEEFLKEAKKVSKSANNLISTAHKRNQTPLEVAKEVLSNLQAPTGDKNRFDYLQDRINAKYDAEIAALENQKSKEVVSETVSENQPPVVEQTTTDVSEALKDVESTAKALEGVDESKLPKVKAPNADVAALRNAKTKEQVDAALLQASQEQSVSKALDNLGFLISGIKEKYFNKDYSWLSDLANEIEKISKETTTDTKSISEAYHKAKADDSNPELVAAVESLLSKEQTPSQSEIEAKKADIEKRRQEELNKETPVKNENIIVNDGTDNLTFKIITFKDGSTLVRHIKTNETTADNKSKKLITYPTLEDFQNLLKYDFDENAKIIKTELVKDDYTDKQSQEVKATKEKTINAKYDAELAALEQSIKETTKAETPTPTQESTETKAEELNKKENEELKSDITIDSTKGQTPNVINEQIDAIKVSKERKLSFDTISEEVEKVENDKVVLKSVENKKFLRQRNVIKWINAELPTNSKLKFKIKLKKDVDTNSFINKEAHLSPFVAVLVDSNGNEILFNEEGQVSEQGYSFGVQFEDNYYLPQNLNTSRESQLLKGNKNDISSTLPTDILNQLQKNLELGVDIYASIFPLQGVAAKSDSSNSFDRRGKQEPTFRKISEVEELSGLPITVRLEGELLEAEDQRTRLGEPYIEMSNGFKVGLKGVSLKDVSFYTDGEKRHTLEPQHRLHKLIDVLDRNGSISVNQKDENGNILIDSEEELQNISKFLKLLFYGSDHTFKYSIAKNGELQLNHVRGADSKSIWDSKINYVIANNNSFIFLPFVEEGYDISTYDSFIKDNFQTSFLPIQESNATSLEYGKVNQRLILTTQPIPEVAGLGKVYPEGTTFVNEKGNYFTIISYDSENNEYTVMDSVIEDEKIISGDIEGSSYKLYVPKEPGVQTLQEQTLEKLKSLKDNSNDPQWKGKLRVTSVANSEFDSTFKGNEATTAGNIVDTLARTLIDNRDVSYQSFLKILKERYKEGIDPYKFNIDEAAFLHLKDSLSRHYKSLEDRGFVILEGFRMFTDHVTGEPDILLVDNQGRISIHDIKTSKIPSDNLIKRYRQHLITGLEKYGSQLALYRLMLQQKGFEVSNTQVDFIQVKYTLEGDTLTLRELKTALNKLDVSNLIRADFEGKDIVGMIDASQEYAEKLKKIVEEEEKKQIIPKIAKTGTVIDSLIDGSPAAEKEELLQEIKELERMFGKVGIARLIETINATKFGEFGEFGIKLWLNAKKGTGFHEGWHRFSQLYLTIKEKKKLYDELIAKGINFVDRNGNNKNTKTLSYREVEEFLADEFAKFVLAKQENAEYAFPSKEYSKGIVGMFEKLMDFLKSLFSKNKPSKLFEALYNGKYAESKFSYSNAMFEVLSASTTDENGKYIVNPSRAQAVRDSIEYYIGEILRESGNSFNLVNLNAEQFKNIKEATLDKVIDKYLEYIEQFELPFDVPSQERQSWVYLNKDACIKLNSEKYGVEKATLMYGVYQDLFNLVKQDEEGNTPNFDKMYTLTIRTSTIPSLKQSYKNIERFEDENNFLEESFAEEISEEDGSFNVSDYLKGPNDTHSFEQSVSLVKSFFATIPIYEKVNGEFTPKLNIYGTPILQDGKSSFNKIKQVLDGTSSVEEMLDRLQKFFNRTPETRDVHQMLTNLISKIETRSKERALQDSIFLFSFINVMSQLNVLEKQLSLTYGKDGKIGMSVRTNPTISNRQNERIWRENFSRGATFVKDINVKINNKIYFDLTSDFRDLSNKEFLKSIGIVINEDAYQDSAQQVRINTYAGKIKASFIMRAEFLKKLYDKQLKEKYNFSNKNLSIEEFEELVSTDIKFDVKLLLNNPLKTFEKTASYNYNSTIYNVKSIVSFVRSLADIQNLFSSSSKTVSYYIDGKLKYGNHEDNVMTRHTKILNQVNNSSELAALAPELDVEKYTWLKNSVFYKSLFDENGNKRVDENGNAVKIMLENLGSYQETNLITYSISEKHPKKLNQVDKMFFNMMSLLLSGKVEITRANNSSTAYSVSSTSYNNKNVLPFSISSLSQRAIRKDKENVDQTLLDYVSMELQKYEVVKNNLSRYPYMTNKEGIPSLGKFVGILSESLRKNISEKGMKEFEQEVLTQIKEYFDKEVDKHLKYIKAKFSSNQLEAVKEILKEADNKTDTTNVFGESTGAEISAAAESVAKGTSLTLLVKAYVYNRFVLQTEFDTWYKGDVAQFDNPFKRGTVTTTTGTFFSITPTINRVLNYLKGETFNELRKGKKGVVDYSKMRVRQLKEHLKKANVITLSENYFLSEQFRGKYKTIDDFSSTLEYQQYKKEMLEPIRQILSKYEGTDGKGVKVADGQGFINLDYYKIMLIRFQKWTDKHDQEYERQKAIYRVNYKLSTGEQFSNDLKLANSKPIHYFNPLKIALTGLHKGEGVVQTKFDKMSVAPLIPEHILSENSPEMIKLMNNMFDNDEAYARFESSSKLNKIDLSKISSLEESFIKDEAAEEINSNYIQQQINVDKNTNNTLIGSQQRKTFYDVIYEFIEGHKEKNRLELNQEEYIKYLTQLKDYHTQVSLNKLGLKYVNNELQIENFEKLKEALVMSLNDESPQSVIDYVKNATREEGLSNIYFRDIILETIGGMLDKDIRRYKVNGTSAINVSEAISYKKASDNQISEYGKTDTWFYTLLKDATGKIIKTGRMGVKIPLKGDFLHLLELTHPDGEKIGVYRGKELNYELSLKRLNESLKNGSFRTTHINKISFYGYRIPTNDNSFLEALEISQFLPESAGNIMIAPFEAMVANGSDFDIDKTNFMFPSLDRKGNLIKQPEETVAEILFKINKITSDVFTYKKRQELERKLSEAKSQLIKDKVKKYTADLTTLKTQLYFKINSSLENIKQLEGFNISEEEYGNEEEYFEAIFQFFDYNYTDSFREYKGKPIPSAFNSLAEEVKQYYKMLDYLTNGNREAVKINIDFEFMSLIKKLKDHKSYLSNQLLSNILNTLESPGYFSMLINPSTQDDIDENANLIRDLTNFKELIFKESNATELSSIDAEKNVKDVTIHNGALGGYSIHRVMYSLYNYSKMTINKVWDKPSFNTSYTMVARTPLLAPNQRDINEIKVHGLDQFGKSIKGVWDQLMSATIDIMSSPKYSMLGINSHNKVLFEYLITTRNGLKPSVLFVNQPILRLVYKMFEEKKKTIPNYMLKHAVEDTLLKIHNNSTIKSKYGTLISPMLRLDKNKQKREYTEKENDFLQRTKNPATKAEYLIAESEHITESQLLASMEEFNKHTELSQDELTTREMVAIFSKNVDSEFIQNQINVIKYFVTGLEDAKQFARLGYAMNSDRVKDISVESINQKERTLKELIQSGFFNEGAITKIQTNSVYSAFDISKIIKDVLGSLFKETIFTSPNEVDSKVFIKSLEWFSKNTDARGNDLVKIIEKYKNDFREFLYKNYFTYKGQKFSTYFENLLYNKELSSDWKSMYQKLQDIIEKYPSLQNSNFLNNLRGFDIATEENAQSYLDDITGEAIYLDMEFSNSYSENLIREEVKNLLNFNPLHFNIDKEFTQEETQEISEFAKELMMFSLYQSGQSNNGFDNFSFLIPNELWQEVTTSSTAEFLKKGPVDRKHDVLKYFMLFLTNNPNINYSQSNLIYIRPEDMGQENVILDGANEEFHDRHPHSYRNILKFYNYKYGKHYNTSFIDNFINFLPILHKLEENIQTYTLLKDKFKFIQKTIGKSSLLITTANDENFQNIRKFAPTLLVPVSYSVFSINGFKILVLQDQAQVDQLINDAKTLEELTQPSISEETVLETETVCKITNK